MVVLVHGGPYVRGTSWRWDAEVQFLASRGYAVLQPEYRGSTGYGYTHSAPAGSNGA
jgi:dipeptidyl aminopeptidase/acylaminoacyl peptidase